MEASIGAYIIVLFGLVVLLPGLPALALVLVFVPKYRPLARDLLLIGVISFVLVILANALNLIILMYVYPEVLGAFRAGAELWSVLKGPWSVLGQLWFFFFLGPGPCLWSCLAVVIGVLLGTVLGQRLGRMTAR